MYIFRFNQLVLVHVGMILDNVAMPLLMCLSIRNEYDNYFVVDEIIGMRCASIHSVKSQKIVHTLERKVSTVCLWTLYII